MLRTAAATPWLPFPPMPLPALSTGHWTDEAPPAVQSALKEVNALVKISVVPEPSERCTAVIAAFGRRSFKPGIVGHYLGIIPLGDLGVVDVHQRLAAQD